MATNVVREFDIMHLVAGHETYKTAFGIVTQALGRIVELLVKVGGIIFQMIFLVLDTDSYYLLLGLDFLIKIRTVVDVENGHHTGLQRTYNGSGSTTTKCSEYVASV
jgi:hypothetical protein